MPKIPKAGFRVLRQGKHVASTICMQCGLWNVMTDGVRVLTIPRHNPVNAITMGVIVRAAGLTVEEFRELL